MPGAIERLNHLGVEVSSAAEVDEAIARLSAAGIAGEIEVDRTCCDARQDKIWSSDPQGARWEFYRVLEDAECFAEPVPSEPAALAPAEDARTGAACGCG